MTIILQITAALISAEALDAAVDAARIAKEGGA